MRIDDLDTPRLVSGMADDIMRTLERFGLSWDGAVSRQSGHQEAYRDAFESLRRSGAIYPCGCSRKEIAMLASAPHAGDDGIPYPGTCRSGIRDNAVVRSYRVIVPDREIRFIDLCRGTICQNPALSSGDFIVRRGDGVFSYQLAVVVDDYLTGVTQVVRGYDLLNSTGRQLHLQQMLGLPSPAYCHLPLVTGPNGNKLSKRDNLVSNDNEAWRGNEGRLLWEILRFLGLNPPGDLAGESCDTLLCWGATTWSFASLPEQGGELDVRRG